MDIVEDVPEVVVEVAAVAKAAVAVVAEEPMATVTIIATMTITLGIVDLRGVVHMSTPLLQLKTTNSQE